jgi:cell division septum initiation protein DivIVA
MEAELKTLEDKLTQFVEVNQRLRDDTQRLRQELASALHRNKQLEEKIQTASNRLEELVQQIPAEET